MHDQTMAAAGYDDRQARKWADQHAKNAVSADRDAGALEQTHHRLSNVADNLTMLLARTVSLADRVLGPIPAPPQVSGSGQLDRPGSSQLQAIDDKLMTVERSISLLQENVSRLERL